MNNNSAWGIDGPTGPTGPTGATGATGANGSGMVWSEVSEDTTYSSIIEQGLIANASANTVTLTFPPSPSIGDLAGFKAVDISHTLDFDGNGEDIEGSATNFEIDVENAGGLFVFTTAKGWTIYTQAT